MKYFYIPGPDGSGKTTFLKKVEQYYQLKGKSTIYIWLRSPKIFSKPLMAYCRIVGLTKYKKTNGVIYGTHEFYRSKFISWLFPILQLVDFKLKWFVTEKIKLRDNAIVLFDRFSLDTLVDLMVDTNNFNMHNSAIGRSLINTIPKNTKTLILHTNETLIKKRKEDTRHDPQLTNKIKCYNILSKELNIEQINNNTDLETTERLIFSKLEI